MRYIHFLLKGKGKRFRAKIVLLRMGLSGLPNNNFITFKASWVNLYEELAPQFLRNESISDKSSEN